MADEKLARIEAEVRKLRRAHRRRRRLIRGRNWLMVIGIVLSPCWCCGGIVYWYATNLPVNILTRLSKYPGAEEIDHGTFFPGSAPVALIHRIYWTEDSVTSVIDHYEKIFPQFKRTEVPSGWSAWNQDDYPVVFGSYSGSWDLYIQVLDADQTISWVQATRHHYGVEFPENTPRKGTLIVISYWGKYLVD